MHMSFWSSPASLPLELCGVDPFAAQVPEYTASQLNVGLALNEEERGQCELWAMGVEYLFTPSPSPPPLLSSLVA